MPVPEDCKKACIPKAAGQKFYQDYMKDPKKGIPEFYESIHTYENIKKVLDLIANSKRYAKRAAKEMGMSYYIVQQYQNAYLEYFENKSLDDPSPSHKIRLQQIKEIYGKQIYEKE